MGTALATDNEGLPRGSNCIFITVKVSPPLVARKQLSESQFDDFLHLCELQ